MQLHFLFAVKANKRSRLRKHRLEANSTLDCGQVGRLGRGSDSWMWIGTRIEKARICEYIIQAATDLVPQCCAQIV